MGGWSWSRVVGSIVALVPLVLSACSDEPAPAQAGGDTADVSGPDEVGGPDAEAPPDGLSDTVAPTEEVATPDTQVPETTGPTAARVETLLDTEIQLTLGVSSSIDVEVPAGVVSMTISVIGDGGTYYGLADWVGPGAFELVTTGWVNSEEGQGGLCLSCPNRIALSGGAFASLAPNNPASRVEAGTHTFSLFGYVPPEVVQTQGRCGDGQCNFIDQFQCAQDCQVSPAFGPARVIVHAKVGDEGLPATGVLDLNLHFTGAQGLTAESARTDPSFQGMLDSMRTIYGQVGLSLGEITYRDIDSGYRTIESLDGPTSDLQAMFSESDGNPNALNLFFVDELSAGAFGGFGVILGIAGGIPGPPLTQGSPRSGVAIAIKPIQGAPAGIDTTMAHEVGHFLGLFHTSEQAFFGPQIHDPLPDTPENDETFLMFNTGAGNKLSEWQGRVMRSNPWVRHPGAQ